MSLPPEKVAELRQAIHSQVTRLGVQQQIQRCLADSREQRSPLDEAGVMQLLEERGVVDRVMQSLKIGAGGERCGAGERGEGRGERGRDGVGGEVKRGKVEMVVSDDEQLDERTGEEAPKRRLHPNKRYLFLRVLGGRAFLDHLQHAHTICTTTLTLHVCFRGQRVHSRPVLCACEPDISEGFLLEVVRGGGEDGEGRLMTYSDALAISEPIHLVVTRTNDRGERDLLGTYALEWRHVLTEEKGKWSSTVELSGVGLEARISSGLLELALEVFPKSTPLQTALLAGHLETERRQSTERERLFLVYSKQWWREFLQIRSEHGQRMVKIFAQDETGRSRSVCSFVRPLRAGRLLDGPRQAARFVSLIPFERASSCVGAGRGVCADVWSSLHTLLSRRKGDVEDHCILLCSLLLGYGLEAYVCVGSKARALAHSWVVTLGAEGAVIFWESLTGQRYRHVDFDPNTQAGAPPPSPSHPYRTIGCLFNHTSFFANAQPSDSVLTCSFDLSNRSQWKPMSPEAVQSISRQRRVQQLPWTLLPSLVNSVLSANEIELELRALLTQHRTDLGLSSAWDDALCYILSPALASYELERSVGVSAGNEEFQDAVRSYVPEGHTFKGFPIQLSHRNARRAFTTCLRSPVCSEIASCRGDHVRLAVRVQLYSYPEDITATWIMFAAMYRSIL